MALWGFLFKWAGLVFQALGFAVVAVGVADTRRTYNGPSLWPDMGHQLRLLAVRVWRRLRGLFPRKGNNYSVEVHDGISVTSTITGDASVIAEGRVDGMTLEQQVEVMRARLDEVRVQSQQTAEGLIIANRNHASLQQQVADYHSTAIAHTDKQVTTLATGGLSLQALGLILAVIGTVFAFVGDMLASNTEA
jgi:hypothetical protein